MASRAALRDVLPRLFGIMLVTGIVAPAAYGNMVASDTLEGDSAVQLGSLPPADETLTVVEGSPPATEGERAMRMEDTHLANERGRQLYLQHRYGEAAPYLLAAAKRGFKMAQARLGEILVLGLDDIDQDVAGGMGWLGVAASGTTIPSIRNRFDELHDNVPAQLHPRLASIVSAYTAKYGADAMGVDCRRHKPVGTHMTKIRCSFEDERRFDEYLYRGYMGEMTFPHSMVTNLYYNGPMDGSN